MSWEIFDRIGLAMIGLATVALFFLPRFAPRRVASEALPSHGPYRAAGVCNGGETVTPELAIERALLAASASLAAGKMSSYSFNEEVERLTRAADLVARQRAAAKKGASS